MTVGVVVKNAISRFKFNKPNKLPTSFAEFSVALTTATTILEIGVSHQHTCIKKNLPGGLRECLRKGGEGQGL